MNYADTDLFGIPSEILYQVRQTIASWPATEIAPLRLVNRLFHDVLTETVFGTITLSPTESSWINFQRIINSRLRFYVKEIQLREERYTGDFGLRYTDLQRWLEDPEQAINVRKQVLQEQNAFCRLRNYRIDTNSMEETARTRVALMEEYSIPFRQRLADEMSLQDILPDLTKSQLDPTASQFCLPACHTISICRRNLLNPEKSSWALPFQPINLDPVWIDNFTTWAEMNTLRDSASTCTPIEQILRVQLPILQHLTFRECTISPFLLYPFLGEQLRYLDTLELRDVVVATSDYFNIMDSSGAYFGLWPLLMMAKTENVCRLKLRGWMRNGVGYGWEFVSCGQCDMSFANKQPCCGLAIIEDAIVSGRFSQADLPEAHLQRFWRTTHSRHRLDSLSTFAFDRLRPFGRRAVRFIKPKQRRLSERQWPTVYTPWRMAMYRPIDW